MLVLVLLAIGSPVLAQEAPEEPVVVPPLVETLGLLAQGLGVGLVLSFLAEKVGAFQRLKPDVKGWVIFGISMGLPVVARVLLDVVPAATWGLIEPYWQTVAVAFLGWASSQAVYLKIIRPSEVADLAEFVAMSDPGSNGAWHEL
jgi:hypothetical protein